LTNGRPQRFVYGNYARTRPGMDERDASAGNRLDIEGSLNGLYASEINASISWIWDGGFYPVLGDPKQAEGWAFPSIGDALSRGWGIKPSCITRIASSRANMLRSSADEVRTPVRR
jgi:hypothetical protein